MNVSLTPNDMNHIDRAPNFGYLDSYGGFHVWHKPGAAINAGTTKDPVNIKVDLDCFGGYPVFANTQIEAGIRDGIIYGTREYPVLAGIIRKLAEAEGIPVK